jgi:hypothetical protein
VDPLDPLIEQPDANPCSAAARRCHTTGRHSALGARRAHDFARGSTLPYGWLRQCLSRQWCTCSAANYADGRTTKDIQRKEFLELPVFSLCASSPNF